MILSIFSVNFSNIFFIHFYLNQWLDWNAHKIFYLDIFHHTFHDWSNFELDTSVEMNFDYKSLCVLYFFFFYFPHSENMMMSLNDLKMMNFDWKKMKTNCLNKMKNVMNLNLICTFCYVFSLNFILIFVISIMTLIENCGIFYSFYLSDLEIFDDFLLKLI